MSALSSIDMISTDPDPCPYCGCYMLFAVVETIEVPDTIWLGRRTKLTPIHGCREEIDAINEAVDSALKVAIFGGSAAVAEAGNETST